MADATTQAPDSAHPLRHRFEAAIAGGLLRLLRLLPLPVASGLGGAIGRAIGPHLPVSRRTRGNLARAMPELDERAVEAIVREMWENLGRLAGEMPHLDRFRIAAKADAPGTIEITGAEHLQGLDRGALFFAGHIANWEIQPLTIRLAGVDMHAVYRSANNRLVDQMIVDLRGPIAAGIIPKGAAGAKRMLAVLKAGGSIGMLVDQKLNDGIAVPFFGRPAMTAPALAQLALKFDLPVIPVTCERLGGPRFRVTFERPLPHPAGDDRAAAVAAMMTTVNARLEHWIRQRPAQWLWLHRRWPD